MPTSFDIYRNKYELVSIERDQGVSELRIHEAGGASPGGGATGTSEPVRAEVIDRVLILTIDNPPVNALAHPVRCALLHHIAEAVAAEGIDGIVLCGAGKSWSAGADIREFEGPRAPLLREVVAALETCAKPVGAALHGIAFGGGLELALACHLRVAAVGTRLGLPEVTLGLLPGAGGTQRLPRLIGLAPALEIMTSGAPVAAEKGLEWGLVDAVVPTETVVSETAARVRRAVKGMGGDKRTGLLPWPAGAREAIDAFAAANPRRFKGPIAASAILETVRTTLDTPLDVGLVEEAGRFEALRSGAQSAALRYSFFSDREASKIPGLEVSTARTIRKVGVVGAGTMGTGIALALLQGGLEVILMECAEPALDRGIATLHKTLARNVSSGRLTPEARSQAEARLSTSLSLDALADVDLVIEAAFENMGVKRELFGLLDGIVKPGAILASNTSYLDIDRIAAATRRPGDVVGLHFFSPANIMKLLEVVKGAATAPDVLATALHLAKRIGKTAVVAGNAHGFIGNRMLAIRKRESDAMILEGASPYDIDRVIEAYGLPMGPFRMSDLAGLDVGWSAATSKGLTVRERLCEAGRRGQKTASGFYDYDEGGRSVPSPEVLELIASFARDRAIPRRAIGDDEILDRLILPMVNEGARILAEGRALRGSDIDVVWRNGYGWPAWRGGPLYGADTEGLASVVARLRGLEQTFGEAFAPSPLLVDLAQGGGSLHRYANADLAA